MLDVRIHAPIIVITWIFQGSFLKLFDETVDEGYDAPRNLLAVLMVISSASAGFLIATDPFSTAAVSALIVGVILAKKIDKKPWIVQVTLVAGCAAAGIFACSLAVDDYFLWRWPVVLEVVILFFLVGGGTLVDELSHEWIERWEKDTLLKKVLLHRWIMKCMALVLPFLFPSVHWFHAVAWLVFDVAYDATGWLLHRSPH